MLQVTKLLPTKYQYTVCKKETSFGQKYFARDLCVITRSLDRLYLGVATVSGGSFWITLHLPPSMVFFLAKRKGGRDLTFIWFSYYRKKKVKNWKLLPKILRLTGLKGEDDLEGTLPMSLARGENGISPVELWFFTCCIRWMWKRRNSYFLSQIFTCLEDSFFFFNNFVPNALDSPCILWRDIFAPENFTKISSIFSSSEKNFDFQYLFLKKQVKN